MLSKITDLAPFVGYAQNEDQTERKRLRNVLKKGDLYFNSGDLMRIDKDNFIYFQDRVGDTFRYRTPAHQDLILRVRKKCLLICNLTGTDLSIIRLPWIINPLIWSCHLFENTGGRVRMWRQQRCLTSWQSVIVSKKPTFMESKCQVMFISSVHFTLHHKR